MAVVLLVSLKQAAPGHIFDVTQGISCVYCRGNPQLKWGACTFAKNTLGTYRE
jgi:hypothetical protein